MLVPGLALADSKPLAETVTLDAETHGQRFSSAPVALDLWTEEEWNRHVKEVERTGVSDRLLPGFRTRGWAIFWLVLLTPTLVAICLWLGVDLNTSAETILAGNPDAQTSRVLKISLLLSVVAGLFCGFWLAKRNSETGSGRILLGLILAGGFAFFSFSACFFGCLAAPVIQLGLNH